MSPDPLHPTPISPQIMPPSSPHIPPSSLMTPPSPMMTSHGSMVTSPSTMMTPSSPMMTPASPMMTSSSPMMSSPIPQMPSQANLRVISNLTNQATPQKNVNQANIEITSPSMDLRLGSSHCSFTGRQDIASRDPLLQGSNLYHNFVS